MPMERTYIMIKPDGVQRGYVRNPLFWSNICIINSSYYVVRLIGEILSRFEKKGFKLVASKLFRPPRSLLEQHYGNTMVNIYKRYVCIVTY